MLATEKNYSRCAVCRAKRAARKGIKRGYGRETMARLHEKVRLLKLERIRLIGYDDGAGDRNAVRRKLMR